MNLDNSFFWRDEIAIITASSLTVDDKSKLKKAKGSGKGRVNKSNKEKRDRLDKNKLFKNHC